MSTSRSTSNADIIVAAYAQAGRPCRPGLTPGRWAWRRWVLGGMLGLQAAGFWCGPEQRLLRPQHVNDLVCDCCDGSDEWAGAHRAVWD